MSADTRPAPDRESLVAMMVAARAVQARCDADGIVASLDSSTSRNVPFYEGLGFEVVAEVVTPGGGPIMRPMHRQPRRSGRS